MTFSSMLSNTAFSFVTITTISHYIFHLSAYLLLIYSTLSIKFAKARPCVFLLPFINSSLNLS